MGKRSAGKAQATHRNVLPGQTKAKGRLCDKEGQSSAVVRAGRGKCELFMEIAAVGARPVTAQSLFPGRQRGKFPGLATPAFSATCGIKRPPCGSSPFSGQRDREPLLSLSLSLSRSLRGLARLYGGGCMSEGAA
jgi:hypothetical protein